jgi:CO/xanthine dehydrogenase FAD-binding subunit
VPEVEKMLTGQRVTAELASKAGEMAIAGANPLRKNAYKLPLTKSVVERSVLELAMRA